MNKLAFAAVLSVSVIVAAAAAAVTWDGQKSIDADLSEPSGDVNAFAWKVFDGVGDGNILVSPLGLYKAIGILANGAGQGTPAESALLKVLGSSDVGSMNAYAAGLDKNGRFERTPYGLGAKVSRPGFPSSYARKVLENSNNKFLVPNENK